MARKRYPPTDPREWLVRAKSNLALARADTVGALLEDLCFEAQQVAEKAVKAVFVHRGVTFPFIHFSIDWPGETAVPSGISSTN